MDSGYNNTVGVGFLGSGVQASSQPSLTHIVECAECGSCSIVQEWQIHNVLNKCGVPQPPGAYVEERLYQVCPNGHEQRLTPSTKYRVDK